MGCKMVSELLFLPWEQSRVDTSASISGEKQCCPLECVPLSRWDPRAIKDKVLTMVDEEGEFEESKVDQSKWASTMMNSFCKMVGFPIVRHECLEVVNDGCIWRPIKSSQKVLENFGV